MYALLRVQTITLSACASIPIFSRMPLQRFTSLSASGAGTFAEVAMRVSERSRPGSLSATAG
jgi:hypothetical protein